MTSPLAFRSSRRIGGMLLAAAREFYLEILGGREIHRAQPAGDARLLFMIEGSLIETGPAFDEVPGGGVIPVDNVEEVATRCWDAGFTVHLVAAAPVLTSVTLIDPFGRSIELVQRAAQVSQTGGR